MEPDIRTVSETSCPTYFTVANGGNLNEGTFRMYQKYQPLKLQGDLLALSSVRAYILCGPPALSRNMSRSGGPCNGER